MAGRVILLTSEGDTGQIAACYLAARFSDFAVIVEQPESRVVFLRRRLKRQGAFKVFGQIVFMVFQRIQQRLAQPRIETVLGELVLSPQLPPSVPVHRVNSVNDGECAALLAALKPDVVLVLGTRIIAGAVLRGAGVPFINYHAGITPKYRGVHGGYWALAEGDGENFGATVHLVDEGIDSGAVLYQARTAPAPADNFSIYPYIQLSLALPMLAKAAEDAISGRLAPQAVDLPSRLWSHPTIWGYLATALRRRVW